MGFGVKYCGIGKKGNYTSENIRTGYNFSSSAVFNFSNTFDLGRTSLNDFGRMLSLCYVT